MLWLSGWSWDYFCFSSWVYYSCGNYSVLCFCFRPLTSDNENRVPTDRAKTVISDYFQHQCQHSPYTSVQNNMTSHSVPSEIKKMQQPQFNVLFSSDETNSKLIPNPSSNTALSDLKEKLQYASNSHFQSNPSAKTTDIFHHKPHSGQLDILKPKPNTSPEVTKHKIPRCSDTSSLPTSQLLMKMDTAKPMLSTKSPLIIDKNDTFIIYRDPALVSSHSENYSSATISPSHMASYSHPHLHTLHSPSPHSPRLSPVSHPHAASHLLTCPHTSALPHPHLLPPGVLPAMLPSTASVLGGHPHLDSPGGLGHVTLPHPATAHQQQFLPVRFTFPNWEI